MIIRITRGCQIISASIFYNFRKVHNVVVLKLHESRFAHEDYLVLVYDPRKKKWAELSHIELTEPSFFEQVKACIKNILAEAERITEENVCHGKINGITSDPGETHGSSIDI